MNSVTEHWLPIKGYEDIYEVSDQGQVRSLTRTHMVNGRPRTIQGGIRVPEEHVQGYYRVYLYQHNARARHFIHRLVAQAFISNPEEKPIVNHKDRNKENNNILNLEWVTQNENMLHWHADERSKRESVSHEVMSFTDDELPFN